MAYKGKAFYHRAWMNHLAALGQWTKAQEQSA
ncbi:fructose-bisphosphate aldolase, class I [Bartonella bacilliformis INS]|uniref:Fructose-bisphosphate aldolase, class I n=1 Tax=Bartonella bacilliformis INS TaxID=1206782 RepID=A0ABN0IHT3_BARBA|nr:fructose-bisphosphate aldolase, class I [Bartonella bacilliformis INS]